MIIRVALRSLFRSVPLLIIVGLIVSQSVSAQSNTFFNQTFTLPANGLVSCYHDDPEYVYNSAGSTVIGTITVSSGYVDFFILNGELAPQHSPGEDVTCASLEPSYWEVVPANLSPFNGYSFTYNVLDNGDHYFVFYNTQAMDAVVTMVLSWANSPTTTSEQVNYPSFTPYTYETQPTSENTAQEVGGSSLPLFVILLWAIAIAAVVLVLVYAL